MQEATIIVTEISEFTFGDNKKGWNLITADQERYACFSSTEMGKVIPNEPIKVRYTTKQVGQYENRSIKQVAESDGTFTDKPSGGAGGGRAAKADPAKLQQDKELEIARNKSIQRQVAAKEATQVMLASEAINWELWDLAYDHILTKLLEVK